MKNVLVIVFFVFASLQSIAQSGAVVEARFDTSAIQIGDQTTFSVLVEFKSGDSIVAPILADTLTKSIEIVEQLKTDTTYSDDLTRTLLTFNYLTTSFDSGYHVVPPINYQINGQTVSSNPTLLEVQNTPVQVDAPLAPIYDPLEVHLTFWDYLVLYWPYLVGSLVFLIAAFVAYKYFKNKPKQQEIIRVDPIPVSRPAHEIALEQLRALEEEKLWQNSRTKQYYSELSIILREYLQNRYQINALELTTHEIETQFQTIELEHDVQLKLFPLLRLADLVKFAKATPLHSENTDSIQTAYFVVEATKIIVEPQTNKHV